MKNKKADVVIIGAGPAGIFTALEMIRKGSRQSIIIVEKGLPVEKRHCPKKQTGQCMNCTSCAITTGFSGAGAFSDGKLSLSYEVGGDLPRLIGENFAQQMIDYTDAIYLSFGADLHIEGVSNPTAVKELLIGSNTDTNNVTEGFMQRLQDKLDTALDTQSGYFNARSESLSSQISNMADRIAKKEDQLLLYQEQITNQFTYMDQQIAQMNAQFTQMQQQLSSIGINMGS